MFHDHQFNYKLNYRLNLQIRWRANNERRSWIILGFNQNRIETGSLVGYSINTPPWPDHHGYLIAPYLPTIHCHVCTYLLSLASWIIRSSVGYSIYPLLNEEIYVLRCSWNSSAENRRVASQPATLDMVFVTHQVKGVLTALLSSQKHLLETIAYVTFNNSHKSCWE